jgi:phage-related protein
VAEDINLPNLISHLAVNLDGLQGTVADAQRQGSSIGAALGGGVQRELRDLLAHLPEVQIDGDSDELDRDLARVRQELSELRDQRIGVDISIEDALRRIGQLTPHIQRLSDEHPDINVQASTRQAARQLAELLAAARHVDDTDVDIDVHVDEERPRRLAGILGRIGGMAGSIGGVAASFGRVAAAVGTALPAAGAVATTLANVAPAAGVAATGLAAVQLASGAVKLAAVGLEDALSAALDPSKAEDFNKALEKLSPSARTFATTVRDLSPQLRSMQQAVQEEVFRGLGANLERTAKSVLPVLRTNLVSTAGALGDMAAGVLGAGRELADEGTLGKALGSASTGLQNLAGVPGIVVKGLGQIAAAAGPSFESLTLGAGKAAAGIGDRLGKAFESGAMQKAIERAVELLGQLAAVGGNVVDIIGAVFNAMPAGGGGMLGVLQSITGELAKIANSEQVQTALRTLFETMGTIGATVAPLIGQALMAIAPVVSALGPPIQTLVTALGTALTPIIGALGPVLQAVAVAVGQMLVAVTPLLPVIGQLVSALLPALTPLLAAVSAIFAAAAPVVSALAVALQTALAPILAQLPVVVAPFAQLLRELAQTLFPVLASLVIQLAPSLATIGAAFGQLFVALGPLITAVGQLVVKILQGLMPIIQPLISLIAGLAGIVADVLASRITMIVIPVVQALTALLSGDFSRAWQIVKEAVVRVVAAVVQQVASMGRAVGQGVTTAVGWIQGLPGRAMSALSSLASSLAGPAIRAGAQLVSAITTKIGEAVTWVKGLPGRAKAALGSLSGVLLGAGKALIQGFIDGIKGMIGSVKSTLGDITDGLTDWKGPPARDAKILTPAGRLLIEGFIRGITGTTGKLRSTLESITKALPANVRTGIGRTLARATAELEKLTSRRDAVIKRLAAAQKKLTDLVKARDKASSDIREGILGEANITSGHADVNSVSAITVELQQALKASQAFQANITRLKKAGLRSDLLQQIAAAGVAGGAATAAALARATPAELRRINDLQAQLAKSASATGATVGDALYGAGVRAAQGLVAGLRSQERQIEATMRRIAQGMLTTVKKAHRTHSPSQAFRDIGVMDMEGWRGGVLANAAKVVAAARTVAADMLGAASGVRASLAVTPTAGQLAAVYAGPAGRGDQHNTFNLYGSEASPDGILRALSWQGLVRGA